MHPSIQPPTQIHRRKKIVGEASGNQLYATLALKSLIPASLLHPSQRLHPMGFLFVWYFVYTLCGKIRTITVKIYPVSYGRLHLA